MTDAERRHRIKAEEVPGVRAALRGWLRHILEEQIGTIDEAYEQLKVLVRLDDPHTGPYRYPEQSWDAIRAYVNGGMILASSEPIYVEVVTN